MEEKSVVRHIEELRTTLLRVILILFFSFFFTFSFGDVISEILLAPLKNILLSNTGAELGKIIYIGVFDKVLSQFQVSLWTSIILSSPLWFYQVWRFIKPALHDGEVKVVRPFIIVSFLLFSLGVLFGYYVVFPVVIHTMTQFGISNIEANINLKDYLTLSSKILVLSGMIFQLPNIILILGVIGIVDDKFLREKRRYVYLGFCVLSAMITPPDVLTMLMLWLPLALLFELGIIISIAFVRPYRKRS